MSLHLMDADDQITVRDDQLGIPDGDNGTVYTLRPITREVYKQTIKRHTTRVPNRRTHNSEDQTDWTLVTEDLIDYALTAWTGVLFHGAEAACDRDMKLRLDPTRTAALLNQAGMSQVSGMGDEVAREASFRRPA